MARQIVMDTTGDTRHEFDPADSRRGGGGREAVQGVDWRGLHRGRAQR